MVTLDIETMRFSFVHKDRLFIGTEEKMLYMLDANTYGILAQIATQSYVFTICMIDDNTLLAGQYHGFLDGVKIESNGQFSKMFETRLPAGNLYKIVKTDQVNEYAS